MCRPATGVGGPDINSIKLRTVKFVAMMISGWSALLQSGISSVAFRSNDRISLTASSWLVADLPPVDGNRAISKSAETLHGLFGGIRDAEIIMND